ncbi:MAG: hypothetical protein LM522_12120, partial [Candidatus Contendobacter sp.]|nr:hypothetical protein [Candidatus Contendobacter sp.]
MRKSYSETIQTYPVDAESDPAQITARRNRYRLGIFLGIFLLSGVAGLTYTFIRPAVYQSTATLLVTLAEPATSIIPAITDPSTTRVEVERFPRNDDPHYAAIQRQVLASPELWNKVYERLSGKEAPRLADNATELDDGLEAVLVGDTNMIELHARGPQPERLPLLLNTWIEIYLTLQADAEKNAAASTLLTLQQQLQELTPKIAAKRQQLEQFRQRYDIVFAENLENPAPAQLKGLQESLNKASEKEAAAKAQWAALKDAIAQGKPVLPNQDLVRLDQLQSRADQLREQLKQLGERFTPKFMAIDPDIVSVTKNLEKLEKQIADARQQSQQRVLTEAERELVSAHQTVVDLQQQLTTRKQTAQAFTARFAEQKTLQQELAQLEQIYQQKQTRLVQEEIAHQQNFPKVTVLNQPTLPTTPIYPNYWRDAGFSVAGSLLLGILAVGLYELLNRSPEPSARSETRLHVYAIPETRLTAVSRAPLSSADQPALTQTPPHFELTVAEVSALLAVADPAGRLLIALLLSGLSIEEVITLRWEQVDLAATTLQVAGANARSIPLSGLLQMELTRQAQARPAATDPVVQEQGSSLTVEDATAWLENIAHEAD